MYKKIKKIRFLFLLFCSICFAQIKKFDEKGNLNQYADTLNGMFNGKVFIYNNNKTISIQGNFIDNQKTGIWIFNDSIGNLKYKRKYKNNYEFENLLVKNDTIPKFKLIRNKNNNIKFDNIKENEIYCGEVEYWFIENNRINSRLFKEDIVFKSIKDYLKRDTIQIYTNSNFSEKLTKGEIYKRLEKFKFEVIGYKIKRFYNYNDKYKITETRLIGICPVIKSSEYSFLIDLFWIYYPDFKESNTLKNNSNDYINDLLEFNAINSLRYFKDNVNIEINSFELSEKLKQSKLETFIYELYKISNEGKYFSLNLREISRKEKLEFEKKMSKYKAKK